MDDSKVFMFPDAAKNSIDPGLLALLNNNGGFGNNGNWIWILFLWMIWGANGNGFGGFGNNGTGFLANQMNNDAGRDLLLQAINGRADAISQLAQITNTGVETVKSGLFAIQSAIQTVGGQVGMSGLETINALQLGNATLSRQLCECCCENRLAIANQTNALQTNLASHDASVRLQLAQNEAADQLSVCQQTNTLSTQNERNTNSILNAIAGQNTLITKEFCDLKERELQNKIDALTADNALLRSNTNNMIQTQQFAGMLAPIQAELAAIKAAQPATITLPNSQYAVVPSWYATGGIDFVASYWANRLSNATTTPTTTPATTNG